MAANSKIEWTHHTFNPWIGCAKVSPGCKNCYAEAQDNFRHWTPEGWGRNKPRRRTSAAYWEQPLKWNKEARGNCERCGPKIDWTREGRCPNCSRVDIWHPYRQRVFCASLADVFDDEVPIEWLRDLLFLIDDTKNLDWLLLTKRPENIAPRMDDAMNGNFDPLNTFRQHMLNVWLGTSAEDQQRWDERMKAMVRVNARVLFVSAEPLLGPIDMGRWTPDWLIVGGDSGPNARDMNSDWVTSLRDQCCRSMTRFFFKQWGGVNKKAAGRTLDGRTWDELPILF